MSLVVICYLIGLIGYNFFIAGVGDFYSFVYLSFCFHLILIVYFSI